jgi:uncharacterized protein YggT (Ycf19 family)
MQKNPYQDDPIGTQPTDPFGDMEELQRLPHNAPTVSDTAVVPGEETEISAEAAQAEARTIKYAIGKLNDYLLWFLMVLEIMLVVRFIFRLIGADPNNPFAGFLYALTQIIILPFYHIVPDPGGPNGPHVFEFSTLIAMAIYALVFYAIRRFLHILISSPEDPAA